ncbi:hypothetical protein QBC37DRAFT_263932, partial [Rhypophila decipiens]
MKYKDPLTGFDFLGMQDVSGFKFGMVLPLPALSTRSSSATVNHPDKRSMVNENDAIIQIISPLKEGGGWGGIVFGQSMVGSLMIVVWPASSASSLSAKRDLKPARRDVLNSPRIATTKTASGVGLYKDAPLTFSQIKKGTFANESHVVATFVCGGCVGAKNSFS